MADERETPSGIPVAPVYRPGDVASDYSRDIADPGVFPFTRGVQASMYRGRLWTMRQYAGFGTAQESNARFRHLLGAGQTGLSVAFDLPTQMGLDPDHPRSRLERSPVRWRRHGAGDQRAMPPLARRRADRAFGGVRPSHADGNRLRFAASARRGGPGRRRDRLGGRPGCAARRHPARQSLHVDDDQRDRFDAARDVRRGG